MFEETFHSSSQLRTLLENAEINHPSSWDDLFGKNKCWLNLQNAHGYSALHYACLFNLHNAVDNLIQAGINITLVDNKENQALHIASSHSDATIVGTLLKQMGENCFSKNRNKMSALEIAIKNNRTDVVRVFILHMERHLKHHPLCEIVNHYSKSIVQEVLNIVSFSTYFCREHGMPILIVALMNMPHAKESEDCKDKQDSFDLCFGWYFGLRYQSHELLAVIFKYIRRLPSEALWLWIKDLVEYKNYKNKYGNTLLHYSCWYHAVRLTKFLLVLNADLVPDKDGNTPLNLSCICGHIKVTRLLLGFKADLIPKKDGNPPLHLSCIRGHIEVTRLLLEFKADLIPNKDGNTPLHLCCIHGYVKEVELLLAHNAEHTPNKDGNTPLHLCCIHGHIKLTKVLLDKGLPVNIQTNASLCPLSYACTKRTLQIVELLLEYGFYPNSMADVYKQRVVTVPLSERRFLPINKAVNHLPEAVCLLLQYGASINISSLGDDVDSVPHMMLIKKIYFYKI